LHHLCAILAICTHVIVAICSLQNLSVIVSMMEFAILMCDCSLHLGNSFLRKVSSSLSFEHDVRTLFVDTTGSRGGEG
jgi:hypothetical protein